ncbi:MAG: hypothetical protein JNK82_11865 [Myxococcaceae bacterium]|nr:hypothetical protein [Myxococcaceae bacterium]
MLIEAKVDAVTYDLDEGEPITEQSLRMSLSDLLEVLDEHEAERRRQAELDERTGHRR